MQKALIVTITEGVEMLPQAAFVSSALRSLGYETRLLPTDFCTAKDGFQTAVTAEDPAAVVFLDGLEWREILHTLAGFACNVTRGPVIVVSNVPSIPAPGGFPARVQFVADGDPRGLASALGVAGSVDFRSLELDYALFGGAALLRRGMGSSLFGDVGTVALLSGRAHVRQASPTAALARLEGALLTGPLNLAPEAALAPLLRLGTEVRAVEWWGREGSPADLVKRVAKDFGLPQTIRLKPELADREFLANLKRHGVTRIVFECDALDEAEDLRLPNAAGTAGEVSAAVRSAKRAGLEAGVLLVIGVPGETAALAEARCERIRKAGPDRVRVVPFEPAGGSQAWDACVESGWWPPGDNRWNREIYQPLTQPESGEYAAVLEHALVLAASVQVGNGA